MAQVVSKNKTKTPAKPEKANGGGHATEKAVTVRATDVAVAPATVTKANGSHEEIYKDAVNEIKSLAENDAYARKIDNGALNEARGKDTWRLHAQLRAVDQVDRNLTRHVEGVRGALHEIDAHLNKDATVITTLVGTAASDLTEAVGKSRSTITTAITQTRETIESALESTQKAVTGAVQTSTSDVGKRVDNLNKLVRESFDNLSKATAGTEENLRTQTDAFSKAVQSLLGELQHGLDKRIIEFRDESTRQMDKRFNQSDVAFAALRADLEVVKALLTDIIKDRLGRPEPRNR